LIKTCFGVTSWKRDAGLITYLSNKWDRDSEGVAMERILNKAKVLIRSLSVIGGITLGIMISLTVADVILRCFRRPILGTYELVSLFAVVVIGFCIPSTSWKKGHVCVDFLISRFSKSTRNFFNIITRIMGIWLFVMFGWNLILYGMDIRKVGEVTPALHLPFYPIIWALGFCCIIQSLVLLCDILKIIWGRYE
jgi:TRAP-type C4-dicarboxylate transport system permease small subunit